MRNGTGQRKALVKRMGLWLLVAMLPALLLGPVARPGLLIHSHDESNHHVHKLSALAHGEHELVAWHAHEHQETEAPKSNDSPEDGRSVPVSLGEGVRVTFPEAATGSRLKTLGPPDLKPLPVPQLFAYAALAILQYIPPRGEPQPPPLAGSHGSRLQALLLQNHSILL